MAVCFARTVILYLLLITAIRLMGKKQVGELEPAELVLTMLVSDLASVPMQDFGIPLLFGVLPILILLCLTMIFSVLTMKSVRFRALLCGRPSLIVDHGTLVQQAMDRNRLTVDELLEELRRQGVTDISSVKYAVLEDSGQVSVILYSAKAPATPEQLGLAPEEDGLPRIIINDGRLIRHNLEQLGKTDAWLKKMLRRRGYQDIRGVFLMTLDEQDNIYLAPKEDFS
ncbi:MAG: DUF421 domain-containing protein [Clostridiales bacterium]|nr:DUF421 domain-containing protein [Clostridiales bacterium]